MLPGAAALVDWYAVARDDRRTEVVAKPLVLVSLIVAAVVLGRSDSPGRRLAAGRRCSSGWSGDVALLGDSLAALPGGTGGVPRRAPGVRGLLRSSWACPRRGGRCSAVALACRRLVATSRVLPGRRTGCRRPGPVGAGRRLHGRHRRDAGLRLAHRGAAGGRGRHVFVASDAILSVNRFVRPVPQARLVMMVDLPRRAGADRRRRARGLRSSGLDHDRDDHRPAAVGLVDPAADDPAHGLLELVGVGDRPRATAAVERVDDRLLDLVERRVVLGEAAGVDLRVRRRPCRSPSRSPRSPR